MKPIDWPSIFLVSAPQPGAHEEEIQELLASTGRPLSEIELALLARLIGSGAASVSTRHKASDALSDPLNWVLPSNQPPNTYLAFLRWSNGGEFQQGERTLRFYHGDGVRRMMVRFCFPQFLPLSLPFADDTQGHFYAFDLSHDSIDGEYPVLFAPFNMMKESIIVARSFLEVCSGTENPVQEYWRIFQAKHKKRSS